MKISKICVLGIALLSGCTPEVAEWTPAESPKENRVDRAVFKYTLPVPAHGEGMNSLEKGKFIEFLKNTISSPYAVRITLEEYGGHSDKRLMDIERELLRFGVPSDLLNRNYDHVEEQYSEHHYDKHKNCHNKPRHQKDHARGSVVVVIVERFVVITPSCSNFSKQIGDASQAYSPSNHGCSTEVNLGHMVANPLDLLRGRQRDAYDGTVMAAGVNRYEHDKVKAIAQVTTTTMQNPVVGAGAGATAAPSGGSY
ncbi:MAG: hypothetical protein H0X26_01795 [Alphaproteobacteria bacterium]|nr:hypothetical protein [Alphaproteobacteria bacterium]